MGNAFTEYLEDLNNCIDTITDNQGIEVDLETKIWDVIDTVENGDRPISIDSDLEDAIDHVQHMINNLEKVKTLLNKTADWG